KRDESIPDFLAHLRAELEGRNIDVADGAGGPPAGRVITKGLLRGCMRGKALEWYDENITTKQNFELHNLLDNTGQANIQAVATRTRAQLGNQALREANDWSIAGGRKTNDAPNAPNANNTRTVVVADIRFGQAI
ncbi:16982_t:CDS:2, partial [Gigaspora rosea]